MDVLIKVGKTKITCDRARAMQVLQSLVERGYRRLELHLDGVVHAVTAADGRITDVRVTCKQSLAA